MTKSDSKNKISKIAELLRSKQNVSKPLIEDLDLDSEESNEEREENWITEFDEKQIEKKIDKGKLEEWKQNLLTKSSKNNVSEERLTEFKKNVADCKKAPSIIIVDDNIEDCEPVNMDQLSKWFTGELLPLKPTSKKQTFKLSKAKVEISEIIQDLINKKDRFTTNSVCVSSAVGLWEDKNCTVPEDKFQKLIKYLNEKFNSNKKERLLDKLNRDEMLKSFSWFWNEIKKGKERDYLKKQKLLAYIKEYMGKIIPPTSLKYDTAKNFAKSIAHEIITGKKQEYKSDGRPFEIDQQVEYKTKTGILKTGKVMKIFNCDIYHQRIIVVKDSETLKSCNRKDKSIIRIIK